MDETKSPNQQAKKELRLRALYGAKLAQGNLLHRQLEERTYFDSGDYALSKAHKPSNIGEVETGTQHPVRETISHPVSAVPASSNVNVMDKNNDEHAQQLLPSSEVNNYSHLREQETGQSRAQDQNSAKNDNV